MRKVWQCILEFIFGPTPGICKECSDEAMGESYTSCLLCAEDWDFGENMTVVCKPAVLTEKDLEDLKDPNKRR